MSEDHKPSLPAERERIEKAGGKVRFDRVNGELAMSRALGDFQYKKNTTIPDSEQLVICIPDISVHRRGVDDEILILACDGVWDVMSNGDAVNFLADVVVKFGSKSSNDVGQDRKRAKLEFKSIEATVSNGEAANNERLSSQDMAEALIDLALVSGSMDNISSIVVRF
jgi:serine/threonine protein phosphatase PrpC